MIIRLATIMDKSVGKVASFYRYLRSPFSMLDFPVKKMVTFLT